MNSLCEEDPTFKVPYNKETGQTIISGMGELHLEIIIDRMFTEFSVAASVDKPQVAYKETITKQSRAVGKFIQQSGGRGSYGHVVLDVDPAPRARALFESKIIGGSIPRSTYRRSKKASSTPPERLSRRVSGHRRRCEAHRRVIPRGRFVGPRVPYGRFDRLERQAEERRGDLLEPIMNLEVITPENYMGDVIGDLSSRRVKIEAIIDRSNRKS